jgi:hypothetical protein
MYTKLSLCLTKHHAMKTYWWSGDTTPHILNLGARWRWVVSFTPRPALPTGERNIDPLDRRLGGPQNRFGRVVRIKIPEKYNSKNKHESDPWKSTRQHCSDGLSRNWSVDWDHMAHDGVQWRNFEHTVPKLRVPWQQGMFWPAKRL